MFGGLRDLLSPDRVRRVVGLALAELKRDAGQDPAAPLRARLAAVERELENVVDLAATHGASEAVRRKLERLEGERAAVAAGLESAPRAQAQIDWDATREQAEALLGELPSLIEAAGPTEARSALREYLGGERLSVLPDAELGYRVEGELVVPWARTKRAARNPFESRAAHPVVAGASNAHGSQPVVSIPLPVTGRLREAA